MWLVVVLVLSISEVLASGVCDAQPGFSAKEQAVVCYAGNFLVKMLGELNGGQEKTVTHVRVHLLPYLGGTPTLQALLTDSPSNPNCTVCYTDVETSKGLTGLRNSLSQQELHSYDSLRVCYALLTERILAEIPQSKDGVWLLGNPSIDPFQQTLGIFKTLFSDSHYDAASCPQ